MTSSLVSGRCLRTCEQLREEFQRHLGLESTNDIKGLNIPLGSNEKGCGAFEASNGVESFGSYLR
jgi:hypothetical protein